MQTFPFFCPTTGRYSRGVREIPKKSYTALMRYGFVQLWFPPENYHHLFAHIWGVLKIALLLENGVVT